MAKMTPSQAVAHIKAQKGGARPWKAEVRGYIDWTFGELSEYLGYEAARQYAEYASNWADRKAVGSNLLITYNAFREAEAQNTQ